MKRWRRIPLNIISTAFLSMLAYVGVIAILNNGIGLGEPMWKGFLIQVLFHSQFSLIVLVIVVIPLFVLMLKFIENKSSVMKLLALSVFSSITGLCILFQGEFWWDLLVPGVVAAIVFVTIEYYTSRS